MKASNCRILVDGADLACAFTDIKFNQEADSLDNTTLCNTGDRTFEPGLRKGDLSFSGIYDALDTTKDKIDDVLSKALDSRNDLILTASIGAIAPGGPALMAKGAKTKYEVSSPLGQLVMSSGEMQSDENILRGQFLFDGAANAGQTSGTSVDNTTSSNKGGIFHAHTYLKTDSTGTNGSFILQHSADNATWVDLIAGAEIGAANGAFAITVAKGVTINRYVRVLFTATGGKAYAVAAFKRF